MASLRPILKATFVVKESRSYQESNKSKGIAILFMRFGEQKKDCSLHLALTPKNELPEEKIKFIKENGQIFIEET